MQLETTNQKGRRKADEKDIRCPCGSLVARKIDHGIEVKCRRCKRISVLSWKGLRDNPQGLIITL